LDPIEVFTKHHLKKEMIFVREVIDLGEKVLGKALFKSGWKPEDLDYIITVSCTGIMIPSLDAYLINKLKLPGYCSLPVTEMGAAGFQVFMPKLPTV
jgi:predicted naringenin-chalcone synthase